MFSNAIYILSSDLIVLNQRKMGKTLGYKPLALEQIKSGKQHLPDNHEILKVCSVGLLPFSHTPW